MTYKSIPETTETTYISGMHSLNLDLQDGTGCGWHFANYWIGGKAPVRLYGEGTPADTTGILGNQGIADRALVLNRLGFQADKVYIADHMRAALDSVYENLIKYKHVGEMAGTVDHYFPSDDHKELFFRNVLKFRPWLDEERRLVLDDWLSSEFRPFYKRWKSGKLQTEEIAPDVENFGENQHVSI